MGGLAADVRGEAQHHAPVQLRRIAGRQIVADDDARLVEVAQFGLGLQPQQIVQDPPGHVAHIGGAFAQIVVFHRRQGGGIAFGDRVESVLGVDALLLNHADDLVQQRAVFQRQQVGVEDAALLGAHRRHDLALYLGNLGARLSQRRLQALDFPGQIFVRQLALNDIRPGAIQDDDFPAANPG